MTVKEAVSMWTRYKKYLCAPNGLGVSVDPSRMTFDSQYVENMQEAFKHVFAQMVDLEKGEIANPDEKRMVGHYWLRDPSLVDHSDKKLRDIGVTVQETLNDIKSFASEVLTSKIRPPQGDRFQNLLLIGIGGSALGPQLVYDALVDQPGRSNAGLKTFFIDNTDPDGIDRCFKSIDATEGGLASTMVVVVSKSGGTPETRNGFRETEAHFKKRNLVFASQAVAITQKDSNLYKEAVDGVDAWLKFFPMWDWVGGRTSETSAVGLVPAALSGVDIQSLLDGAQAMDKATRVEDPLSNPAALLAMMWYFSGNESGDGSKAMVVLPYKDRLLLMSRYLQQLVMESLGKEKDLDKNIVHQGLVVYGNKGSTDQHAYIQQLRDGLANFFATFIQVLEDGGESQLEVEPGITSGDFLLGFQLGTQKALSEADRGSVTITIPRVDAEYVGKLIALFERAVGFYATLINVNAYHQPGVEAGKEAAGDVLELQSQVMAELQSQPGVLRTAEEIAEAIERIDDTETVYKILEHRAWNPQYQKIDTEAGAAPTDTKFGWPA